jgi:hypothetical protein
MSTSFNKMKKKMKLTLPGILLVIFCGLLILLIMSKTTPTKAIKPPEPVKEIKDTSFYESFKNAPENEKCLACHGQSKFQFENKENKKTMTKKMFSELIIKRNLFYESNHRQFKCTDCHSEDYLSFPHAGNLMMQMMPNCLDCHGGDQKYAKYHFENIEAEFKESVHVKRIGEDFTCWKCHNGHVYKITARPNENIKKTIAYDNAICLNCHTDSLNFQLLTDKENPNIITKHDWLPNQRLHFASVRCIECHTKKSPDDSTLVAHEIQPKQFAVKKCQECHSTSSVLMAALYQYEVKEIRSTRGFITGSIVNDRYVIGANRNYFLNVLSLIIAGLVIIGIFIHAFFRIIKKQ